METESTTKKLERTVLDSDSITAVKKMMNQVESELGDIVHVTQKIMVNFIIKNRSPVLTPLELEQLKSENYDLIKALKRATDEAIKAKQNGSEIQIDAIIKLIQTPGVKFEMTPKKPRGRKKKEKMTPISSELTPSSNDEITTANHAILNQVELNLNNQKNSRLTKNSPLIFS